MKKILVIEDNPDVRENIVDILRLSGYEVFDAPDGKAGVEAALREKVDLIVCDIMMPVLDGYGVLHLLNKQKEGFGIPFIFLTAKSEKADFRKGMELGADDYITKPFDGIELLNAIEIRLAKADKYRQQLQAVFTGDTQPVKEEKEEAPLLSDQREVYTYVKKQVLYSEGQRPKALYYIISGRVKTYRVNEDGKELVTNLYGPGDFFGYAAILEDCPHAEHAQMLEDTDLMLIPREEFTGLMTNNTQVARQFIKMIAHDVNVKEEALVNFAYNSLRKKVAYALIQAYDKLKKTSEGQPVIELSRDNLAATVGVATESLIRTLSDFKSEKLIGLERSVITILNEQKLRNLPY